MTEIKLTEGEKVALKIRIMRKTNMDSAYDIAAGEVLAERKRCVEVAQDHCDLLPNGNFAPEAPHRHIYDECACEEIAAAIAKGDEDA